MSRQFWDNFAAGLILWLLLGLGWLIWRSGWWVYTAITGIFSILLFTE